MALLSALVVSGVIHLVMWWAGAAAGTSYVMAIALGLVTLVAINRFRNPHR